MYLTINIKEVYVVSRSGVGDEITIKTDFPHPFKVEVPRLQGVEWVKKYPHWDPTLIDVEKGKKTIGKGKINTVKIVDARY